MVSFAAELAGDVAKMAQVENLGTLLDEVYPDGSKAPDDFAHWVVKVHRSAVPVTNELLSGLETTNYLPKPTTIVPVATNNPRSPDNSQVDGLGMSMRSSRPAL